MTETDPLALTDDDQAMLSAHAEEVVKTAKGRFSLKSALQGAKLATAKIVLFLDNEAAVEWAQQEVITDRLAGVATAYEAGSDLAVRALQDFNEADDRLNELRETAFRGALAVHMRAVPQVALEMVQRKAKKEIAGDDGQVKEEDRPRLFRRQDELLLGQVVLRIVNADGDEADFDRARLYADMNETLPVPQFARLMEAFNLLMFNDSLARAATADPGF